jgi:hypothetical protein
LTERKQQERNEVSIRKIKEIKQETDKKERTEDIRRGKK